MEDLQKKREDEQPQLVCTARLSIGFVAFLALSSVAALIYVLIAR